ncbi:hypothetical protein RRG08_045180 [Elysia crispata]|uniref:Uncharacterized protein n=1 Tax=Elysia crispata TaxID=231223 RepID=A0AAE1AE73_9GAST|nr:hypothetical protein RRG08_045180 [Elysia crispata]
MFTRTSSVMRYLSTGNCWAESNPTTEHLVHKRFGRCVQRVSLARSAMCDHGGPCIRIWPVAVQARRRWSLTQQESISPGRFVVRVNTPATVSSTSRLYAGPSSSAG